MTMMAHHHHHVWRSVFFFLAFTTLSSNATEANEDPQKRNCCHLSESELQFLAAQESDGRCPRNPTLFSASNDRCQLCPPASCRMDTKGQNAYAGCVCADDFLSNVENLWDDCQSQFGASWPSSEGVVNQGVKSCPAILVDDVGSTITPTSAPVADASPADEEDGTTKAENTPADDNSGDSSLLKDPEILGALIGGAFTMLASVSTAVCVVGKRKRRKRNKARRGGDEDDDPSSTLSEPE